MIHLGSIVFSAIVITIVKALRAMMSRRGANPVGTFIFMIISFVWGAITYILKILNHYATISMAMTGQGYIASAKTAGLLIFNNVALFATVDIILVKAASDTRSKEAIEEITALLHERHRIREDQDDDFTIRDMAEILSAMSSMSQMMGGFGSVSPLAPRVSTDARSKRKPSTCMFCTQ